MPPQVKISKKDIIEASLSIVRENGAGALNARTVAKRLNCSTQPIFSNYAVMEDLKNDVIQSAKELYKQYIERGMKASEYPPYKASGLAYIRFSKEEKELFKLLFMRDRSFGTLREERDDISALLKLISKNTGLDYEEAYAFHLKMWVYAHGIATMLAAGYLEWDWDMISAMLTDVYESMRDRYKKGSAE